ncbi:hypothetical protein P4475_13790 [Halalkalibacterium halodurans]|uniref:hypothetical protein n=1 Tax=Halalkalibacterium halodurans TaxID=86665 RepID=UPI0010FDB7A0|nr:hypothetical protein [Halalkalibacterium halodurans]MED3647854.1 hypothetical protein [Halalkalibacterium halodurans]MED4161184.1 hypothetical protein [Halalkalibacterium halodurans]
MQILTVHNRNIDAIPFEEITDARLFATDEQAIIKKEDSHLFYVVDQVDGKWAAAYGFELY